MTHRHRCHANGCTEEAHPEIPFCKRHFQLLPAEHRSRLWAKREKGVCGACVADDPSDAGRQRRASDWNMLLNLGIAIVACIEAPQYDPQPEWLDEHGFCWVGGLHDATKTVKTARAVIKKFNLSPEPPPPVY